MLYLFSPQQVPIAAVSVLAVEVALVKVAALIVVVAVVVVVVVLTTVQMLILSMTLVVTMNCSTMYAVPRYLTDCNLSLCYVLSMTTLKGILAPYICFASIIVSYYSLPFISSFCATIISELDDPSSGARWLAVATTDCLFTRNSLRRVVTFKRDLLQQVQGGQNLRSLNFFQRNRIQQFYDESLAFYTVKGSVLTTLNEAALDTLITFLGTMEIGFNSSVLELGCGARPQLAACMSVLCPHPVLALDAPTVLDQLIGNLRNDTFLSPCSTPG